LTHFRSKKPLFKHALQSPDVHPESKKPTPEGPALETPIRGYYALPPEGAKMSCPKGFRIIAFAS
jgi:hypothetical protein